MKASRKIPTGGVGHSAQALLVLARYSFSGLLDIEALRPAPHTLRRVFSCSR